ncbi:hypothetical protein RND81_01G110800 [Saponaria officinalis]|uniref:Secreted protein n=1 Tax=Saponaria officinalis TaxID=3572 RepID=A0AAW1NI28_SAPOF
MICSAFTPSVLSSIISLIFSAISASLTNSFPAHPQLSSHFPTIFLLTKSALYYHRNLYSLFAIPIPSSRICSLDMAARVPKLTYKTD